MVPDAIWPGVILTLGSTLRGVAPCWWVATLRVGEPVTPGGEWGWEGVGPHGAPVMYKTAEDAIAAGMLYRGVRHVGAVAVIACDRPPPPVPSGEESTACDATVIRVANFASYVLARELGPLTGRGELVHLISKLYARPGGGAGKGGSRAS